MTTVPPCPLPESVRTGSASQTNGIAKTNARLRALEQYQVLDSAPEPVFDDIALLASTICRAPTALISFVASDRQWFKARIGFEPNETPLAQSVCAHTLQSPGMLVIPDLTRDERTRANTLVTGAPFIRFYAGARLVTAEGEPIGALCVIDTVARPEGLSREQAIALEALARQIMAHLEMSRAATEKARERDRLWHDTTDLLGIAGQDGYFRRVNPAWTRVLGWSEEELLARPFFEVIAPEDHARTQEALKLLDRNETVTDFYDALIAKDGAKHSFVWSAFPDGEIFHFTGRDITELRKMEEQLRHAQKMEAVGQLTGGLAHDFNNLLTAITGSLDMVEQRFADGRVGDVGRYLAGAQGAVKRAANLTHRLLAFSRQQTLAPEPVDLNILVAGMEELIRRTMGPEIDVVIEAAADTGMTLVDPGQLENALLNLSINARDAMPEGGTLTIATSNRTLDALDGRAHVALAVRDTGTGMPPEIVARAFDPFFTTKPLGLGTGLGLSMVYGFASQSGGQTVISSEIGGGTEVCIYLPQHEGRAVAAAKIEATPALAAANDETVLVVEDEETVRMLVVDLLGDMGYAAIEASDAAAGLKVLQSGKRIDLLITDVGLPGDMSGRRLAEAARLGRAELKVLFITGYAENSVLNAGHLQSGMQILTKPFAMKDLAARVSGLLAAA